MKQTEATYGDGEEVEVKPRRKPVEPLRESRRLGGLRQFAAEEEE